MSSYGVVVFNNFNIGKELVFEAVHEKTVQATEDLLKFVVAALDAGEFGLHSDRRALAESMYVQATGRDDYQAAKDAARTAFEAGADGEPSKKARESFDALLAARSELPDKGAHVFVCALATMLAYGTWWETDGGRPWMTPAAFEWAQTRAKEIFEGLRGSL